MKVVKKTGLVPVFSKADRRVIGVPPAVAREMIKKNEGSLVSIPSGIETFEVDVIAKPAEPKKPVEYDVAIPDDWESLHFLQQIKLAKALRSDYAVPEGTKPLEYAKEVIREEAQRRAVAVNARA